MSVVVPFLAYAIVYYAPILRNAPFKSADFVSFQYQWGEGPNLQNSYDSATGSYQYLNNKDSLIITHVKLKKDDLLYIHHQASELGFWNFPSLIANKGTDLKTTKVLRYRIQFNYKTKTKTVDFVSDFDEIPKLRDVAVNMKTMLEKSINDAEDRYKK